MCQGVPLVVQVLEPRFEAFQVSAKFWGQGFADEFVALPQAHTTIWERSSGTVGHVSFVDPNMRKVVDASENIEYEGLQVDRRVQDVLTIRRFLMSGGSRANTLSMQCTNTLRRRDNP